MKTEKVRFYTERNSFGVQAMVVLIALSIAFRLIGCWGSWSGSEHGDSTYLILQIILPVVSALLLIALVWLFGRRALWLSLIPVMMGAVFFIIKSTEYESKLNMVLSILLCAAVIGLYFCTMFGFIRTKWFLVLLFGLAFLFHVFIVDLAALRNTENPVSFADGMQEMGALCVILGMFFVSLTMRKSVTEHHAGRRKLHGPGKHGEQPATEPGESGAAEKPADSTTTEPAGDTPAAGAAAPTAQQTGQLPMEQASEPPSESGSGT